MGAVDYITKPISPPILKERIHTHLELKRARDQLKQQNQILEDKVLERTRQLEELQDVAMVAMGSLAETRDPETGNHIRRTQHYVKLLANRLKDHPRFNHFLTPENVTTLFKSAPLHDIGKVGVPDHILLKPGKLTVEEFEEMKKHTTYGRDAIAAAELTITSADNFLIFAKEIAYSHQEKWDGSGYPEGLSGDNIPISARLMAVADVYDALISRRVYKPPFPHEQAVAIITEGKGAHFDPDMVDAFLDISDQFYEIALKYADTEEDVLRALPTGRAKDIE
jgi:putative two-component system response regulator